MRLGGDRHRRRHDDPQHDRHALGTPERVAILGRARHSVRVGAQASGPRRTLRQRLMPRLHPVILCGGTGTRLWPLSRRLLPKQFLPLVTDRTLLQDTILRIADLPGVERPIVISNNEHRFLVAEQLHELGVQPAVQILEPAGRNTAPAVAVAALHVRQDDPDAVLLVLPSDHAIGDPAAFREAVLAAARIAGQGFLATFGIRPTQPHTGYGYIELGEPLSGETQGFRIRRFVEKPDLQKAKQYLDSGRFLWNSGMFVFSARRYLEELAAFRRDILECAEKALKAAGRDLDFLRLDAAAFNACPAEAVKDIVGRLDKAARSEHISHTRVYRPWGYYESIDAGERFQVKRIMVKPGEALSLQMHHKRAEHWVVVSGRARVTRDDQVYELRENESTFIPLGAKHRLENTTDQPLYLIEVQSGSYLGEDDIVRYEDRYDRR